jgi:hypothetical protein
MQKCGPWAKARCRAALGRRTSKVSGLGKTAGSRLAAAMDTVTWSPARMAAPARRVSVVANRSTTAAAGSSRSDSSIAPGSRSRSSRISSSPAGWDRRCQRALAIMPSVVSMPPNSRTAALEMASVSVSGPVTWASSEAPCPTVMTSRRWPATSANAALPAEAAVPAEAAAARARPLAPAAASACTAASAWTAATIPSYQERICAGSSWPRPRISAMTAAANGPASVRRSSASPRGARSQTRRSALARINGSNRA